MPKQLYRIGEDDAREGLQPKKKRDSRTEYRRDFSRLIHTPCFRRLQGKTQLFPGVESDFFRNRLTHSLEVAQIAKSIASNLNQNNSYLLKNKFKIDLDLVEFAGLAHDLGHPPFGHVGEEALNALMYNNGGYEGNAQTLRILTRIEKKVYRNGGTAFTYDGEGKDNRLGLNPTYRSIASIYKYDEIIPFIRDPGCEVQKAFYSYDMELIKTMKQRVTGYKSFERRFKTIECHIMEIADDVAYSTYDFEDSLKANFLTIFDLLGAEKDIMDEVVKRVNKNMKKAGFDDNCNNDDIRKIFFDLINNELIIENQNLVDGRKKIDFKTFMLASAAYIYNYTKVLAKSAYKRNDFTSRLIDEFINGVELIPDDIPALSEVRLKQNVRKKVEALKNFVYVSLIESSRLRIPAFRGKEIVEEIFKFISSDDGFKLLPDDYKNMYRTIPSGDKYRNRIICDFIAGMTDRYAIEFYGRLKSENPETIFKPI